MCPSCKARRAHDTAIHLTERVLPRAPYRQWTLSLPMPVRFCLARDARLLSEVLGLFVRALFTFQRRTARRLGVSRPLTGAVAFVQRFGSALQLTRHFHVLVPEAVFEELDGAELRLHPLPRPTDPELETLAVTVARRTLALLRARGVLEEEAVADGVLAYFASGLTNGRTEGFNNKAKVVKRRAYGYRSFQNYRLRLLNACE